MDINKLIEEKLSKKDARFLRTKIRSTFPGFEVVFMRENPYDILLREKKSNEALLKTELSGYIKDRLEYINTALKIHDLYRSLDINLKIYVRHWSLAYEEQRDIQSAQNKMKPNLKQDNKGYYVGSGNRHGRSVRVPSKKRKTAWKRFVKLFPGYEK